MMMMLMQSSTVTVTGMKTYDGTEPDDTCAPTMFVM